MTRRGGHGVTPVRDGGRRTGVDRDGRPDREPRVVSQDVTIAPEVRATVDFELT